MHYSYYVPAHYPIQSGWTITACWWQKYNTEASDEESCPCSKLSEHAIILFYTIKIFPMTQAMHVCSYTVVTQKWQQNLMDPHLELGWWPALNKLRKPSSHIERPQLSVFNAISPSLYWKTLTELLESQRMSKSSSPVRNWAVTGRVHTFGTIYIYIYIYI